MSEQPQYEDPTRPSGEKFSSFWDKYEVADLVAVPVNCMGVMGAGLAKAIYGKMSAAEYAFYKKACEECCPGDVVVCGKFVFCFTKDRWWNRSKFEWIESCLEGLASISNANQTLLLPRLGCGLGGLSVAAIDALYARRVGAMFWKEVWIV